MPAAPTKTTIQKERNEILRLLKPQARHHYFGSNGFNTASSYKHEMLKLDSAFVHSSQGHSVILEAAFETGGRCDVLCLDCRKAIEIVVSESEESIQSKEKRYPDVLDIDVVRSFSEAFKW